MQVHTDSLPTPRVWYCFNLEVSNMQVIVPVFRWTGCILMAHPSPSMRSSTIQYYLQCIVCLCFVEGGAQKQASDVLPSAVPSEKNNPTANACSRTLTFNVQ